jgi:pimeloyl-ACP methyl ester carboxylesterase
MEIGNGELTLHVAVDGEPDAPAVLLLHGITSTVRTWDWAVPHLVGRYRVIRLDFRGHGRSDRAPGEYHYAGYVSDAAAACRQLAGGPCAVIGHSLGGGTAAALAQQHPELVRAVVLEDPPLGISGDLEDNALRAMFALMRESVPRLQADGIPVTTLTEVLGRAPSAAGRLFGELLHPDALEAMAAGMLELDATVLDPVLDGTMRPAFDPDQPIPVPVLVLAADPSSPDVVARTTDLERIAASSPHARISVVGGASHLVHDELAHRDQFLDETIGFLTGLDD